MCHLLLSLRLYLLLLTLVLTLCQNLAFFAREIPGARGALPEPFDVGNHIGNIAPSLYFGHMAANLVGHMSEAANERLVKPEKKKLKRKMMLGALAVGVIANGLVETRLGISLTGWESTPDSLDFGYGVGAAVLGGLTVGLEGGELDADADFVPGEAPTREQLYGTPERVEDIDEARHMAYAGKAQRDQAALNRRAEALTDFIEGDEELSEDELYTRMLMRHQGSLPDGFEQHDHDHPHEVLRTARNLLPDRMSARELPHLKDGAFEDMQATKAEKAAQDRYRHMELASKSKPPKVL